MKVGLLILHLHLPGCDSLKAKRGRLKPLLTKLRRDFNVSAAEVDLQDVWQSAVIACALVSNDHNHTQRALQKVARWIENEWRDVTVMGEELEML